MAKMAKRTFGNKADLSLNTIVVAALVLVVMVVLIMIFTGRLNLFTLGVRDATDCSKLGGTAMSPDDCPNFEDRILSATSDNSKPLPAGKVCCKTSSPQIG